MAVLPFALLAGGLTLTSATDVVIFAIACMALNILVGHTGLVSFGHGAWFGVGAYAAALTQRHWFPGLGAVADAGGAGDPGNSRQSPIGFLVLRRRGVYFSLLTLALSALTYAIAFRWTAFTGGESGLGGVTRASWFGIDLENPLDLLRARRGVRAWPSCTRCSAFTVPRSARVLVAIRENEQRAQFIGYATNRYKQIAYVRFGGADRVSPACCSRSIIASPRPIPTSIAFSGELLAMVIIGGMRSLLGPALGALFYILFRNTCRSGRRTGCCTSACCSSASSCSRRPDWSGSGGG